MPPSPSSPPSPASPNTPPLATPHTPSPRELEALDLETYLSDPGRKQSFVTPMFEHIAPRYDAFVHGQHLPVQEQQPGTAPEVPGLPSSIDAASTAHYTRAVLAGTLPVPPALAQQVEYIVQLSRKVASPANAASTA